MIPARDKLVIALTVVASAGAAAPAARAADWYVSAGAAGSGTAASPFGRIQDGLLAAQPGDTVRVRPGTYREALTSVRGGTPAARIAVRAESGGPVIVTQAAAPVLRVDHAYLLVEGLILDGQYAPADTLDVASSATGFVLRNAEVRRSGRDCIDIGAAAGVSIERSLVHHCLNAAGGRTDAHGIVAGAVHDLTIRDTEVHTFSGDAFQVDPGRSAPGWDRVTIEGCRFWLGPLPAAENGFPAGVVPGENAVDTKTLAAAPRAHIVIRDTQAWGFRGGLVTNMAAFNLKEQIDAVVDRVTVWDSEIAFRVRGITSTAPGAWAVVQNAVVHDVTTAVRYEDDLENFRFWNATVGANVTRSFQAAASSATLDVRNLAVLGGSTPPQASDTSNLALPIAAFVDVQAHDYRLTSGAAAIDRGAVLPGVTADRNGVARPQGTAPDVGAFEWCTTPCLSPPAAPTSVRITR
jgi:hypothetical protein